MKILSFTSVKIKSFASTEVLEEKLPIIQSGIPEGIYSVFQYFHGGPPIRQMSNAKTASYALPLSSHAQFTIFMSRFGAMLYTSLCPFLYYYSQGISHQFGAIALETLQTRRCLLSTRPVRRPTTFADSCEAWSTSEVLAAFTQHFPSVGRMFARAQ